MRLASLGGRQRVASFKEGSGTFALLQDRVGHLWAEVEILSSENPKLVPQGRASLGARRW